MSVPRWFMDAGEEGFSILGKAFKKDDPEVDAIMRVLARRAKSSPGQKFYDPEQDIMERLPASSWKEALDRLNVVRAQSDKDADVVLPWKYEGKRPDDIRIIRQLPDGNWQPTWEYANFVEQQKKQSKPYRDKTTGQMMPAKPFSAEFTSVLQRQLQAAKKLKWGRAGRTPKDVSWSIAGAFADLANQNTPREWTGEAALASLRRARRHARERAEAYFTSSFGSNANMPAQQRAELTQLYEDFFTPDQVRVGSSDVYKAIKVNKPVLETMTNRQRAMFFELLKDWEDDSFEGLAETAIALTE